MNDILRMFIDALQGKDFKIAAVLAVIGMVFLVKRYVGKLAFLDQFKTPRGSAILAIAVGSGSAVLSAVGVGAPVTVTLLLAGLTAALFDQLVTGEVMPA